MSKNAQHLEIENWDWVVSKLTLLLGLLKLEKYWSRTKKWKSSENRQLKIIYCVRFNCCGPLSTLDGNGRKWMQILSQTPIFKSERRERKKAAGYKQIRTDWILLVDDISKISHIIIQNNNPKRQKQIQRHKEKENGKKNRKKNRQKKKETHIHSFLHSYKI